MVIGGHFGGGDHFDGGDHFGGSTGHRGFVEIISVFLESSTGSQSILINKFSFQPKSKGLVKIIMPLFLTPIFFFYKKYINRPESYFSI